YSLFRDWLSSASTRRMVSSCPGLSRRARAAQRIRLSSSGCPGASVALCMSTSTVIAALLALLLLAAVEAFISLDDALHQRVTYHILGFEVGETDALHILKHVHHVGQARTCAAGQVDLSDVAGDHGGGAKTDAREEHLHLFQRGVLAFIEDDEAVVQCAPAHIGQGRD